MIYLKICIDEVEEEHSTGTQNKLYGRWEFTQVNK